MFGYSLNYLIDVEATPTRITKEVDATETMIERTEHHFALKPEYVTADVAYGTGEMLGWLVDHDIDPHIPVWDKGKRDDAIFSRQDFIYNENRDVYICPDGKTLKSTGRVFGERTLYYRASKLDCERCSLKLQCCPKAPERRLRRDIKEAARDYARALTKTESYRRSRSQRKKIETLFGEVTHNLALTRLRLRGLIGAKDEFLLIATVQNLKRLAKFAAIPPPQPIHA
jgi:hypothetical protein